MSLDIGGIILHNILLNPSTSLNIWAKLRVSYFNAEYTSIYITIGRFYEKFNSLPSFTDLETYIRNPVLNTKINALNALEIPEDIDIEILLDALINEFAQKEALVKIDKFLDSITLLDAEEVKQELANILLYLEEKTHSTEEVILMSDVSIIEPEEIEETQIPLGFSNPFDANVRASLSQLIMIGGKLGTGKSVVACNICCSQYEQGNVGLMFSIEMKYREVFDRFMAILSDSSHDNIKNGEINLEESDKLAKVRADMFENSAQYHEKYLKDRDLPALETSLISKCKLKEDNQLIIIDNQKLTLADIDMNIQRFKAQFGDKLKVVVVDYVNEIHIEDVYNWSQQISLSKGLKNLARKYNVVMVTPYQIDDDEKARFARAILNAADIAIIIEALEEGIIFKSKKIRGSKKFKFTSGITWNTLRISPEEIIIHTDEDEDEKEKGLPF